MTNSALVDRAAQHHPVRGAANQPLNPGVPALFDLHRPHDCGPVSYPRAARSPHRPHGTVADQVRRRARRYSLDSPGNVMYGSRSVARHSFMSCGLPSGAMMFHPFVASVASDRAVVHRGSGVDSRKEGVEAFGQQWVREDRVGHRGVSELAQHGDLDDSHDLAAFTAED